jgi:hypothetical protein
MIFDVAEPAFHSERSGNELHGGDQLLEWHSFKNLNVLVNLFRRFSRPDACSRGQALRPKGESSGQRQSSAHKRKSQGLQHRSISRFRGSLTDQSLCPVRRAKHAVSGLPKSGPGAFFRLNRSSN